MFLIFIFFMSGSLHKRTGENHFCLYFRPLRIVYIYILKNQALNVS